MKLHDRRVSFDPWTAEAVMRVMLDLRDLDRREIMATAPWEWSMVEIANHYLAHVRWGHVVTFEGRPIAVIGGTPQSPGTAMVGVLATDDWPLVALPMAHHIRRVFMPMLDDSGIHRVEARSLLEHKDAHAWMGLLGGVVECILPDLGRNREPFIQYAWRRMDWVVGKNVRKRIKPCA